MDQLNFTFSATPTVLGWEIKTGTGAAGLYWFARVAAETSPALSKTFFRNKLASNP